MNPYGCANSMAKRSPGDHFLKRLLNNNFQRILYPISQLQANGEIAQKGLWKIQVEHDVYETNEQIERAEDPENWTDTDDSFVSDQTDDQDFSDQGLARKHFPEPLLIEQVFDKYERLLDGSVFGAPKGQCDEEIFRSTFALDDPDAIESDPLFLPRESDPLFLRLVELSFGVPDEANDPLGLFRECSQNLVRKAVDNSTEFLTQVTKGALQRLRNRLEKRKDREFLPDENDYQFRGGEDYGANSLFARKCREFHAEKFPKDKERTRCQKLIDSFDAYLGGCA